MWLYKILIILLWPLLLAYTLRLALRYKSLKYLKQRLGFSYPKQNAKNIWIHCASVGEINTALPLISLLQKKSPTQTFIISSNTVTGEQIFLKQKLKNCQHVFLPIDSSFGVKNFLNSIKPSLALILETELWPQLYQTCGEKNIPICLINARLSHKTLNSNRWIKKRYQQSFKYVSAILAKSEKDQKHFITLGADTNIIKKIGNLKLSNIPQQKTSDLNIKLPTFIVLASSHHNEEEIFARLWLKNKIKTLLVIVPRHPERGEKIQQSLSALGCNTSRRSAHENIDTHTQIYIADTLGELTAFMQQANIVIIGGSFIKHGGQNLLEPARLGKAIILGPHMFNFTDETDLFLQHKACLQVSSIEDLEAQLESLLIDSDIKIELQKNALDLMAQCEDIPQQYFDQLKLLFPDFF